MSNQTKRFTTGVVCVLLALTLLVGMLSTVAIAAETDALTPEIVSYNYVLGGKLSVNFRVDAHGQSMDDYSVRVTIGNDTEAQNITAYTVDDEGLYVYTAQVMAHRLNEELTVSLLSGETVLETSTKTIAQYAQNQDSADAVLQELLDALMSYGDYAAYFKGAAIAQPSHALVEAVTAADLADYGQTVLTSGPAGLNAVAALYLDEACDLRVKFNAEAAADCTLYVNGQAAELTANGTQLVYTIAELLPQDWDTFYNFRLQAADGTTVFEMDYSVLSYIRTVLRRSSNAKSLDGLMKAMYLYWSKAEAYIAANGIRDELAVTLPIVAADGVVTEELTYTAPSGISFVIPVGTKVEGDTVTLRIKGDEASSALTLDNRAGYEVTVDGVAADNTAPIVVSIPGALPADQSAIQLCHDGSMMYRVDTTAQVSQADSYGIYGDRYCYNSENGDVTFSVTHFSNISVASTADVVVDGVELTGYTEINLNEKNNENITIKAGEKVILTWDSGEYTYNALTANPITAIFTNETPNPGTYYTGTITVETGASVVLNGVNIRTTGSTDALSIYDTGVNGTTTNIYVADGTRNYLVGRCGIGVATDGTTTWGNDIVLAGGGFLCASAMQNGCPAIGPSAWNSMFDITINVGHLRAHPHKNAAGIGGGSSWRGFGDITIEGGVIQAYSGGNAAAIGSGVNGSTTSITVKAGNVYCYNQPWTASHHAMGSGTYSGSCNRITIYDVANIYTNYYGSYYGEYGSETNTLKTSGFKTSDIRYVDTVKNETDLTTALDAGHSVILGASFSIQAGATIAKDQDIMMDLNGYTLSYASSETQANAAITNKGTLTIEDSGEDGKITYSSSKPGEEKYATNTIMNLGTLIVNDGTIENTTENLYNTSFAIDSSNAGGNANVVINGGHVVANARAVRQFVSSATNENNLTVNGGVVESITNRTIWLQLASDNAAETPNATLTVNGGTLTTTGLSAINTDTFGASLENVVVTITDGIINGEVTLNTNVTANISGGTFTINSYGGNCINAKGADVTITGGTFYVDSYAELNTVMASQGEVTIILAANIEIGDFTSEALTVTKDATVILDLAGHTISGVDAQTGNTNSYLIHNNGDLTIKDSVGGGKITLSATTDRAYGCSSVTVMNHNTLTVESGTIEHTGGHTMAYAIDSISNTETNCTITGGTVTSSYIGIRQCANHTVHQNYVTITGGTIYGGNLALWIQQPTTNEAHLANLVVTGGTFTSGNANYKGVYLSGDGLFSNTTISVATSVSEVTLSRALSAYAVAEVDGYYTLVEAVASIDTVGYATLASALAYANTQKEATVTILADLDLTGWTSVEVDGYTCSSLTIDGGNHTITGLTQSLLVSAGWNDNSTVIKNLTVSGAAVTAGYTDGVGVLIGKVDVGHVTITNVHVVNSTVTSGTYTSGLIGYAGGSASLTIDGCSVKNVTVTGGNSSGALIGHAYGNIVVKDTVVGGNTINNTNSNVKSGILFGTVQVSSCEISVTEESETTTQYNGTAVDAKLIGRLYGNVTYTAGGKYYTNPETSYNVNENSGNTYAATIADGYAVSTNDDGTYSVTEITNVASVNGVGYATLEAAIEAAQDGDTVIIFAGAHTATDTINVDKSITIKGEGELATVLNNVVFDVDSASADHEMNVVFDNIKFLGTSRIIVGNRAHHNGVGGPDVLPLTGLTVQNCYAETSFASDSLTAGKGQFIWLAATYCVKLDLTLTDNTIINAHTISGEDASPVVNGNGTVINNVTVTGNTFGSEAEPCDCYVLKFARRANGATVKIKDNIIYGATTESKDFYILDLWQSGSNTQDNLTVAINDNTIYCTANEGTTIYAGYIEATVNGSYLNIAGSNNMAGDEAVEILDLSTDKAAVAKIGDAEYYTLQAAIDAAEAGATVTLVQDVALADGLEIASDDEITLNLNGKTLSYASSETQANAAITNYGTLTITGNGTITYSSTNSGNYVTDTIINYGKLTVNSGTIENTTATGYSYAIDNISNSDAYVTINGGNITATKVAIRQFANTANVANSVTINGGTISADARALWIQHIASNTTLNITGGTVGFLYINPWESTGGVVDVNISGGIIDSIQIEYETNPIVELNMAITGGTITNGLDIVYTGTDNAQITQTITKVQSVEVKVPDGYGWNTIIATGDNTDTQELTEGEQETTVGGFDFGDASDQD